MVAINKNDYVLDRKYADVLVRSCPIDPRDEPTELFAQDGIFIPLDKAKLIDMAFRKKPIECDSVEEYEAMRNAVIELGQTVKKAFGQSGEGDSDGRVQ